MVFQIGVVMPSKDFFQKVFAEERTNSNKEKDILAEKGSFLEKKDSLIQGKGIFSTRSIPVGKEFYLVPMDNLSNSPLKTCTKLHTNLYLSDEVVLNWVNHSCDPNAELLVQSNRVVLKSRKEIKAGDEITIDYCLTEDKNNLVNCNCRSEKCRNFFFQS